MAGSGLLALIDDVTTMLDDIAVMTKVAAGKAVGVVGDDVAIGAEQLSSVNAARELSIVKKVAKGSLGNKLILTPITIGVSALAMATGWPLIVPLLIAGGAFLCHESFEKIAHKPGKANKALPETITPEELDALEKKKIKGAIKTDFVLSSEIMLLTLGVVAASPLLLQVGVLAATGLCMTGFVYGLVAGIVRLDDLGALMLRKKGDDLLSKSIRGVGRAIIKTAPWIMKGIAFTGTAAMFLVGGGILMNHIPLLTKLLPHAGGFLGSLATGGAQILTGLAAGATAFVGLKGASRALNALKRKFGKPAAQPAPENPEVQQAPAPEEPRPALGPKNKISPVMSAAAERKADLPAQAGNNPAPAAALTRNLSRP